MKQFSIILILPVALLTACTGVPMAEIVTVVSATTVAVLAAQPSDTPAPTNTRTPEPPPTDTPTSTSTRRPKQTDTLRPEASNTPTPDPTDTPIHTSTVTWTPEPTDTPIPDPTDTPTPEPPTETPVPEPPTATPIPNPPDPPDPAPPAAAPAGSPFAYGIQADHGGDPAQNIDHLNRLGFEWVKFQVPWKQVEPHENVRNWDKWDRLVQTYHNAGFKILLSVVKAPDWARPAGTDLSTEGPPADPGAYARFVGELASRYKGGVNAIEVWNEQNLAREGGGTPMPPEEYIALLSAAYQAIKTADPSIVVVSGGPTPAGDVPGLAVDDVNYLNGMYAAGLKNVSDAIGVHPSGYNCPAGADWRTVTDPNAIFRGPYDNRHHSWCFRGTMEGYRNVMLANGDDDKALGPTEFGWAVAGMPPVGYEYAADNTPEEQARWIVEAYQQARAWGWVGPMFLWNLDYGITHPGSELAAFGILTPHGPMPAFNALANMPKESAPLPSGLDSPDGLSDQVAR